MDRPNCAQAKSIDMVNYLASLEILPQKVRGENYWYLSPFRDEKQPSFKIARGKNLWYDHGIGIGGDLLRFGVLFHQCSLSEFLNKLSEQQNLLFSYHQPFSNLNRGNLREENKLHILSVTSLSDAALIDYAKGRGIPMPQLEKYLKEVRFSIGEKNYLALGFENQKGGYELRSENFKGSSSPKDITLIKNGGSSIAVFEGFFSFLSYLTLTKNGDQNFCQTKENDTNFLVLNSLSFLDRGLKILKNYSSKLLYLDNDNAGRRGTEKLLQQCKNCEAKSSLYQGHKDLNDYLVHENKIKLKLERSLPQKQKVRRGRHI